MSDEAGAAEEEPCGCSRGAEASTAAVDAELVSAAAVLTELDEAVEGGHDAADSIAREWLAGIGGVNGILVSRTVTERGGGSPSEVAKHGSPLYIAAVLCLPHAIEYLLKQGADVNFVHPAPHSDTAVLHCAERGYYDCLKVLLEWPAFDPAIHLTSDFKIFLGQAVPQYEEGGRTPLLLAASAAREKCVELLIARHPPWLHTVDSFGRSPLEAVLCRIATVTDNATLRTTLMRIATLLSGGKTAVELENLIPSFDDAIATKTEQNRRLRQRWQKNEFARNASLRAHGLAMVAKHYTCLHHEARTRHLLPGDHLAQEIGIGSDLASGDGNVEQVVPGVHALPLLDPAFALKLWQEFHHYEKTATECPDLELPLHTRHDGNMGSLQDCGYLSLLTGIEDVLAPLLRRLYPEKARRAQCKAYHAFLVRSWLGRQASYLIHTDKSDLTINICLYASADLEGSTVGFYSSSSDSMMDRPTEAERVCTYSHKQGRAVVHDGTIWHKTDDIKRGTRGSLIVWARWGELDEHDAKAI